MLKSIAKDPMVGETIKSIEFGHPDKKEKGSYGCYTFVMESGERFVVSQGLGEVTFYKEID